MATKYTPAAGQIKFIRGFDDVKKINVSAYPRSFQSGSLLWLNKVATRYQAEPALTSATNPTTDFQAATANAGDATSIDHARGVFMALCLGISAGARIPQQNNSFGQFSAGGAATAAVMDASKPFISFYDEGIFAMPVGPSLGTNGVLTAAVDPGTWVTPDGFQNETGTGFYDGSGQLLKDALYYLYSNCVTTTTTIGYRLGVVVERAEIGSSFLVVRFNSPLFRTGALA